MYTSLRTFQKIYEASRTTFGLQLFIAGTSSQVSGSEDRQIFRSHVFQFSDKSWKLFLELKFITSCAIFFPVSNVPCRKLKLSTRSISRDLFFLHMLLTGQTEELVWRTSNKNEHLTRKNKKRSHHKKNCDSCPFTIRHHNSWTTTTLHNCHKSCKIQNQSGGIAQKIYVPH